MAVLPAQVQQQWMFLENIFTGSEDISRQLALEAAQFTAVNASVVDCMRRLQSNPKVVEVGPS